MRACLQADLPPADYNGFLRDFSLAKNFLFFILGPIMVIYVLVVRYFIILGLLRPIFCC